MGALTDFAGGKDGKFFGVVPGYVDTKQKPGFSKLPKPTAWDWVRNALLLKHVWASPNTIWSAIALAFYLYFPYDLSSKGSAYKAPLSWAFFWERFPLWFAVTMGYNLFFHVTIYFWDWAKRPFLPARTYRIGKVLHNAFWNVSGIVIWTGFDNVFAHLWATGRLPYLTDAESFHTPMGMLKFALALIGVPLWREAHFYFAHRLLHFKPIYAQVHALHHRNQDIEPFAGLSMHPIEHYYYYACVAPSLIPYLSPFAFVWNGMHLLLSPGASHSGYEDHMQSDAFHYMHHRFFECNYAGFGAAALDVFFGTFVESFAEKHPDGKLEEYGDAKSTLLALPSFDFVAYLALASAPVALWFYAVMVPGALAALAPLTPITISLLAGFGSVIAAIPFSWSGGTSPFEAKNAPLFHLGIGSLVCSVPMAYAAYLSFLPAGAAGVTAA